MALSFGTTTDRVDCGSASVLDNLLVVTVLIWFKPVSIANQFRADVGYLNNTIAGGSLGGIGFVLNQVGTDGSTFKLARRRATTDQTVTCPTGTLVAGAWQFCGGTVDMTSGSPKAFYGTLTKPVTDVTTSATDGVGAAGDDSTNGLCIGNSYATASNGANASIAWVGLWNRRMALDEVRSLQFRPRPTPGCLVNMHMGISGSLVGVQADRSGYMNHGTVTGAVRADHVPIIPPVTQKMGPLEGNPLSRRAWRTLLGVGV